jgi:phosphotriesterase-related protein
MNQAELVGKVQTVLGLIDADSLGVTSPHEHLLHEMSAYFVEPTEATERRLAHEPVSLENLWWVRSHCVTNLDNITMGDEQLAIKEALFFKRAGGDTIVELTSIGMCRDPLGLARVARATGLNIIMGSGYYIAMSHPPELATKTEEEISEEIVRDIMVGVGSTGVRAGIIGEIGCSEPLTEIERRVLRAAATAQQRTGAAINVHPVASDDLTLQIISILSDAGADLSRTIISHVDIWNYNRTTCHKLADAGCYIEYDSLRSNAEIYPPHYLHPRLKETPSNLQVIDTIIDLIGEGYLSRLLVAQDTAYKHHLVAYGGCGYAHILRDIVPVMRYKGISNEQIHTLLVENPKRVLQFAPVKQT